VDTVREQSNWEAWLAFFLEGVAKTTHGAVETAQRLMALFDADRGRIQQAGRRASSALRVHDALKVRPVHRLQDIARSTGLSFPTAAAGMQVSIDLQIAREVTGKRRNRAFAYDSYLGELNQGTENS